MANYEPQIKNSLDKHSEMTNAQFQQRLHDSGKDFEQQMIMMDLFKTYYEKQDAEKVVVNIDTKQAKQEIDRAMKDLNNYLGKFF